MPRLPWALALLAAATLEAQLNVPNIRQLKNGCGAASLAMLIGYWKPGPPPDHPAIYAKLIDAERKGILLADMKSYLEAQGFRAFTLRATPKDLDEHLAKGRPLIVPIKPSARARTHFIVLTAAEQTHITFNDPTKSQPQRWPRAKFEKQWSQAENWLLLATPR